MRAIRPAPAFLLALALTTAHAAEPPLAITGGLLIDGRGGAPVAGAQILIEGNLIRRVGPAGSFPIPDGARRLDARGRTVLPGYVDLHFHMKDAPNLVPVFLANGVTSGRDPGAWIEEFEPIRRWQRAHAMPVPGPRLFLCGPHLDGPGPAYPRDSVVILSPEEARLQVRRAHRKGATAIKVYFRLPLESIRAAADEAHRLRIPVTAHLEVIDPRDAIEAGVDGIEHITSLGLALIGDQEAERYRQAVLADNSARNMGRYRMWASIDPHSSRALDLARFLAERRIFVDPNLAVFERQAGDRGEDVDAMVKATRHMQQYTGVLHRAGVPIVVGSHTSVPHAPAGMAYHRELELLVKAGLSPMEALVAATRTGAAFLGRSHDLGTVEEGKLADLVIAAANPLDDIRNASQVETVIVDGRLFDRSTLLALPPVISKEQE